MFKSLRSIIVIAAIVSACLAAPSEQKKKAEEYGKVCIEKIGISPEVVLKVLGGDLSIEDSKIECFAKCFFEQAGFMNAEGEFLDEVVIDKLSKHGDKKKVKALVNTCKLRVGSTPCETAFKIYKCYVERKALKSIS